MQNMPIWVSHEDLVATLEDILEHVRAGDSFEGSIEYLLPGPDDGPNMGSDPGVSEAEWFKGSMVRASYRFGNRDHGQGFLRMIGELR